MNHYSIYPKVDPLRQFIDVEANISLHAPLDEISNIEFFLHRELNIKSLTGDKIIGFHYERDPKNQIHYIPESGKVSISLYEELNKDEIIKLEIKYEGTITEWPEWSANVVSDSWTELGLYFPWFPYNPDLGDFTFSVDVECNPEYYVCSFGDCVNDGKTWRIEWKQPTNDIVIGISKQ